MSLTEAMKTAAIAAALAAVAADPTISNEGLRAHVHDFLGGGFGWWGEATDACLDPAVIKAVKEARLNSRIQAAFAADKAVYDESFYSGAVIDNPWITEGLQSRTQALAKLMNVIALREGGNGNETCAPEPIRFDVAHRLATEGRELLAKYDGNRDQMVDGESRISSDGQLHALNALHYMDLENAAIGNGTYKAPEVILREIQEAAFRAREAAGG